MQDAFIQHDSYATHFGTYRAFLDRVLNHDPAIFDLPRSARIVDIGCGYGNTLRLLRSRGYTQLLGVEPDPVCRGGTEGFDVLSGTLTETGLPSASVDCVLVNNVFHHVSNYSGALEEVARILKPNGLLCFIEPLNTHLRSIMDFLTFRTPLGRVPPIVQRHRVMMLEMQTGLYPKWLREQRQFHGDLLGTRFDCVWLKRGWFFQFGKYRKQS